MSAFEVHTFIFGIFFMIRLLTISCTVLNTQSLLWQQRQHHPKQNNIRNNSSMNRVSLLTTTKNDTLQKMAIESLRDKLDLEEHLCRNIPLEILTDINYCIFETSSQIPLQNSQLYK